MDWMGRLPLPVSAAFTIGGALFAAFSSKLPIKIQSIGLLLSGLFFLIGMVGFFWHFYKSKRSAEVTRIPITELLDIANKKYRWDFAGKSMDPLDLQLGLRQAGVDGHITYWGREVPENCAETLIHHYPLVVLPSEHFKENHIWAVGAFANIKTKTFHYGSSGVRVSCVDIHVDKGAAKKWLLRSANEYRGMTDRARASALTLLDVPGN